MQMVASLQAGLVVERELEVVADARMQSVELSLEVGPVVAELHKRHN
jgi:hypothetical protein